MENIPIWAYILIGVGSGSMVAFITQVFGYISERRKRKEFVADRGDDTQTKLDDLKTDTNEQFVQVNVRINEVEEKVDMVAGNTGNMLTAQKAQQYDTIRHRALVYIKAGSVTPSEKESLIYMLEAYRPLDPDSPNTKFLDQLLEEVCNLRTKLDYDNL